MPNTIRSGKWQAFTDFSQIIIENSHFPENAKENRFVKSRRDYEQFIVDFEAALRSGASAPAGRFANANCCADEISVESFANANACADNHTSLSDRRNQSADTDAETRNESSADKDKRILQSGEVRAIRTFFHSRIDSGYPFTIQEIAAILYALKDRGDNEGVIEVYESGKPFGVDRSATLKEFYAVSLNKVGRLNDCISVLKELQTDRNSQIGEICGILGKVYELMADRTDDPELKMIYLQRSIDELQDGFYKTFEYYPGINLVYNRIELAGLLQDPQLLKQAFDEAGLVMYSAKKAGAENTSDYWAAASLLEASLFATQYNDRFLDQCLLARKHDWEVEATLENLRKAAASLKILYDRTVFLERRRIENILSLIETAIRGLKSKSRTTIRVDSDPRDNILKNGFMYGETTTLIGGNIKFGGQLQDHIVNRFDVRTADALLAAFGLDKIDNVDDFNDRIDAIIRRRFHTAELEDLHSPAHAVYDRQIKNLLALTGAYDLAGEDVSTGSNNSHSEGVEAGDNSTLSAGVEAGDNSTLSAGVEAETRRFNKEDVGTSDNRNVTADVGAGTHSINKENIGASDNSNVTAGIGTGTHSINKENIDTRTNVMMDFLLGKGDCRQHAHAKQLLFDAWKTSRLNFLIDELRIAKKSAAYDKAASIKGRLDYLLRKQMFVFDSRISSMVKMNALYDPQYQDGKYILSDKYEDIEDHTWNGLITFAENGHVESLEMADSFYQTEYGLGGRHQILTNVEDYTADGIIVCELPALDPDTGETKKVPVRLRPTVYAGDRAGRGIFRHADDGAAYIRGISLGYYTNSVLTILGSPEVAALWDCV